MRALCAIAGSLAVLAASTTAMAGGAWSRPPVPSAGCGTSHVESGQRLGSMEVEGASRTWVEHVPQAHDGHSPVPVVIQFHGFPEDPTEVERQTGFGRLGSQEGFVVVAPAGRGHLPQWYEEDFGDGFVDATRSNADVVFIDALLDRLGAELCVDLGRVYATGFSNGGAMTSVLACALEDRLAAVAPVG